MMKNVLCSLVVILLVNLGLAQKTESFQLNGLEIKVAGLAPNCDVSVQTTHLEDGLGVAKVTFSSGSEFVPENISFEWSVPSTNIAGYWGTSAFLDKTITPDWGPATVKSMLARHSPVISLFGHDDVNRHTFAVSEALNTVLSSTAIKEENGMVLNEIKLFSERHEPMKKYEIQLRLDTRSINYATALAEVNDWWETFALYKPAYVPEAAKLPVYSTWYSYHQNVDSASILEECVKANEMGYEVVIVDDGWQTLDGNRGYAYTGDWLPERIPDMKELVEKVHALDMKFVLWYAVPFVGEKSRAYEKMKGKFLSHWKSQGTYVLDPRYPEVREFIINTYVKALKEWNLDGFKLDFIGRFRADEKTELVAENGRDYASVNKATDKLMTDLMTSLREVKPDVLVEFRQPYTGPLMKKYGNMLRASDCPNVAMMNRVETTDLRLVSGKTAVHADMLMWHYDETVEAAALQFLNVLFSVPQISVRLKDIPEEHVEMIDFYSKYWLQNRDVLLEGDFFPKSPQLNYPMIAAHNREKMVAALYSDGIVAFNVDSGKDLDVINATLSDSVILSVKGGDTTYEYSIFDCKGNSVENKEIVLKSGGMEFKVPPSGMIKLKTK